MEKNQNVQAQLQSLSIDRDKRPVATTTQRGSSSKLTIFALIVVTGATAAYFFRDKIAPAARSLAASTSSLGEVELFTVTLSEPPQPGPVLTATGKIVSDHTVSVATKVSGQVVSLHFEQGDIVTQGQLLATIEDVLYRARRDESAANLARSTASLEYQKVNFQRVSGLIENGNAKKIEFADAKRALDEAAAQVDANKASLAFFEKTLADCKVVAPIGGVILQRNVEVGEFVAAEGGIGANANARFAIIADMTKLRVEVDISELDITRVKKDMPCTITPDAYKGRKYQGHVMWLDPGANYSKATIQAKVRIDGADEYLRVDGSAQVSFQQMQSIQESESDTNNDSATNQKAIWIPISAIRKDDQGETYVFLNDNGHLKKQTITHAESKGDRYRVTKGLSPAQEIATKNTDAFRNGMRINRP